MDLAITDDGDLRLSNNGDFAVTDHRYGAILQEIFSRVRTELGDFVLYPWFGSNIYKIWGLPNDPKTGSIGSSHLLSAITHDGKLSQAQVSVKPIPTSPFTIRFDIDIRFSRDQMNLITLEQKLNEIGGGPNAP